ncbi:alanine racemase [Rhizobiales bacterium GAS113]|nr:alanine racemase [Rhizobiales bacterium GAS113]
MTALPVPSNFEIHARPNRFDIDLGAIAQLTRRIRGHVGEGVTIFAALKCNAYGFGLVQVARTILAAGGDALSMVDPANAIELRRSGIEAPILVYPGVLATPQAVSDAEVFGFVPTLIDLESAEIYSRYATRPLRVAAKVDIGQERLGFPAEEAAEAIVAIARLPKLEVHIVNAHPNVPSPPSLDYLDWQFGRFEAMCGRLAELGISIPIRMIASSKVLALSRRVALNAVDPGQMFFGPFRAEGDVPWPTKRQAFRKLTSRLIHVRALDRREFLAQAPFPMRAGMRIGVIPIGSADGMAQLHCGEVLIRGRRARLIGSPSLEHTRIDLSELPQAELGDEVVIVGEQGGDCITSDEVVAHQKHARIADLAMAVRPSIPRRYIEPD